LFARGMYMDVVYVHGRAFRNHIIFFLQHMEYKIHSWINRSDKYLCIWKYLLSVVETSS